MQIILYVTLLVRKYREQQIIKYGGNHEQRYEEYGFTQLPVFHVCEQTSDKARDEEKKGMVNVIPAQRLAIKRGQS